MLRSRNVAIIAILVVVMLAAWPMYQELHNSWRDRYGTLSHGYLVLALSLWFGLRAWRAPPPLPSPQPAWWALPVLVMLVACSFIAELLFIGGIRTALLPPLFLAAVATGLGVPAARRLVGPAAFMYFGLPIWSALNNTLQSLTTRVAQAVVQLCGVPAYVEGNFVHLPAGTFQIAAGCAGTNFLVVALTLGAYACVLYVNRWPHRWKLMLATAVAGLVANWLRVSSLIIIGHVTDMQHYLVRVDHLVYGWVLFLVAMLPVFWLVRRFADAESAPAASVLPAAEGAMPILPTAIACVVLLAPAWWLIHTRVSDPSPIKVETSGSTPYASGWQPHFTGAHIASGTLGSGVEVFRADYAPQTRDSHASLAQNTFTGAGWREVESRIITLTTDSGPASVVEHRGFLQEREQLVWGWYEVSGRVVASKIDYRLAELLGLMSGSRVTRVIALNNNCQGNCSMARVALEAAARTELNAGQVRSLSQNPEP